MANYVYLGAAHTTALRSGPRRARDLLVGSELDEGVDVGEPGPDAFMERADAKRPGAPAATSIPLARRCLAPVGITFTR
ncbi:MAG: hypothetical protein ABSA65_03315 [Acidimicrobiales bacterium]